MNTGKIFGGLLVSALALATVPALADDGAEMELLRKQLEELQRQDQQRKQTIQALEQRLEALEVDRAQIDAPAKVWRAAGPARVPRWSPLYRADKVQSQSDSDETGEPQRKTPAPSRAAEAVAQQDHVLFDRKFTFEPSITYSRFDRQQLVLSGFLALDAIFLGNISVDEVEADVVTVDLTGRYGITERLQVSGSVPFIYRVSNFISGGAGGAGTLQIEERVSEPPQIGDVSVGASYRLLAETDSRPDVVLNVNVKAPTGSDPYGDRVIEVDGSNGNLSVPEELPSGNGLWAISTGISLLKTIDPAIIFANASFVYNVPKSFDDIASADGNQPGRIYLGNAIELGFGLAYALNERTSLSLSYTHRLVDETETEADGGEKAEVIGSDASVGVLSLGLTYGLSDNLTMVTNVGVGVTPDAADVSIGVRLPYTF